MSILTDYLDKAALGLGRVATDINVWAREVSAEARAAQGELQRGSEECYGYANIPNSLTNRKCFLESLKITKRMADFNERSIGIVAVSADRCTVVVRPKSQLPDHDPTTQAYAVERFWLGHVKDNEA